MVARTRADVEPVVETTADPQQPEYDFDPEEAPPVEREYDLNEVVEVAPEEDETTTTRNFMGQPAVVVDEVVDTGVRAGERAYRVRTWTDVGPIFYGTELVEMKAGVAYDVPHRIYEYLQIRGLLWEQQAQ